MNNSNELENIEIIEELLKKYAEECQKAYEELEYEALYDTLAEIENKYIENLRKLNVNVVWEWIDEYTTSQGIGFRHEHEILYVCNLPASQLGYVKRVFAEFHHGEVYDNVTFELVETWIDEVVVVDEEETPFTARLIKEIPWEYIRPTWQANINKVISVLAEAERAGKLDEKLAEVMNLLNANAWIYDYQHILNAIKRVKG